MLLNFPPEVICLISEELDNRQDRYSLILSCRQVYEVALPVLYSDVILCRGPRHSVGQLSRFFYTIAQRPHLAGVVRALQLAVWETEEDQAVDCKFEYDDELINNFLPDAPWRDKLAQQLFRGNTDAWLALLIPHLKGLKRISMCYPSYPEYVDKMFCDATKEGEAAFPRLTEVLADWRDAKHGIHPSSMEPLFKFPVMRKIVGTSISEYSCEESESSITPSSGITDIDLNDTNTEYGFGKWIESCKALRSFRLTTSGSLASDGPVVLTTLLRKSISLNKTTLERFWLSGQRQIDEYFRGQMGSFVDFSALKYLRVPVATLVDPTQDSWSAQKLASFLPPSLEILYLCHCEPGMFGWALDQIEDLVDSKPLPHLTSVGLEGTAILIIDLFCSQIQHRLGS
ncbi:hypothetical protein N7475_000353 [Penicillium sp. IBT 31633x]|nr:hypothetical protein N7475_000353 [Penicillium sp. IBT 31633x]